MTYNSNTKELLCFNVLVRALVMAQCNSYSEAENNIINMIKKYELCSDTDIITFT